MVKKKIDSKTHMVALNMILEYLNDLDENNRCGLVEKEHSFLEKLSVALDITKSDAYKYFLRNKETALLLKTIKKDG